MTTTTTTTGGGGGGASVGVWTWRGLDEVDQCPWLISSFSGPDVSSDKINAATIATILKQQQQPIIRGGLGHTGCCNSSYLWYEDVRRRKTDCTILLKYLHNYLHVWAKLKRPKSSLRSHRRRAWSTSGGQPSLLWLRTIIFPCWHLAWHTQGQSCSFVGGIIMLRSCWVFHSKSKFLL